MAQLGNRFIELKGITKVFQDDDTVALENIDLYICNKEFLGENPLHLFLSVLY